MRCFRYFIAILAVIATPLAARQEIAVCATSGTTPAETLFLHRQAQRARAGKPRALATASAAANRDIGDIAVIEGSDGNLSFTAGENAISARSLGRMTGGPPRIAALFDDLDPSSGSGSVRYFADATHAVFSWVSVREYSDFGIGTPQTFQIRLFVDGSIEFAYTDSTPAAAVVGIAPGYAKPGTAVVSFANDVSGE